MIFDDLNRSRAHINTCKTPYKYRIENVIIIIITMWLVKGFFSHCAKSIIVEIPTGCVPPGYDNNNYYLTLGGIYFFFALWNRFFVSLDTKPPGDLQLEIHVYAMRNSNTKLFSKSTRIQKSIQAFSNRFRSNLLLSRSLWLIPYTGKMNIDEKKMIVFKFFTKFLSISLARIYFSTSVRKPRGS